MRRVDAVPCAPPSATTGMTLVEMLVVLAIMGIASASAVLVLGGGHGASGQVEARRLAARVQLAADDAMVSDRVTAIIADAHSYGFVQWDAARRGWRPSTIAQLAERHALPAGLTLETPADGAPTPLNDSAPQGRIVLLRGGGRQWGIGFDGLTAHIDASQTVREGAR